MGLKASDGDRATWTFLSNHGNVLLVVARNPDVTLREVAKLVGITERAVQRIVADLEAGRYLERVRTGRRNRYKVHSELPLRHPIAAHRDIGALIELVTDPLSRTGKTLPPRVLESISEETTSVPSEARHPACNTVGRSGSRDGT
jgi:hypothetical protein